MANKEAVVVSCGASFTAVGTSENVVYFWGTRFISPTTRPSTRDAFGQARLSLKQNHKVNQYVVRGMKG